MESSYILSQSIAKKYIRDVYKNVLHPHDFFKDKSREQTSNSSVIAYALVTHWIGTAIAYFWQQWLGGSFLKLIQPLLLLSKDLYTPFENSDIDSEASIQFLNQLQTNVQTWIWGAGSVITDPIVTLVKIYFTTTLVLMGCKLLIPHTQRNNSESSRHIHDVNFLAALKIVCYGMTPGILIVIPIAGIPLAAIFSSLTMIIGAKELFHISYTRATIIALFPKLLFLMVLFSGLAFIVFLIFQIFSNVFMI